MEKLGPQAQESQSIYRERVSDSNYLERMVGEIDSLAEGKDVLELSKKENTELLDHEADLEKEFYESWKTKIRSFTIDLDWLTTKKGRSYFCENTGIQGIPEGKELLPKFLYQHTEDLSEIKPKIRKNISGEGTNFRDEQLFDQLSKGIDQDGKLTPPEIDYTERLTVLLDPEKWVAKNEALRLFKDKLKKEFQQLGNDPTDRTEARRIILNLYAHRVNIAIAGLHSERRATARKADALGVKSLTEAEKIILGDYEQEDLDQKKAPFITDQHFRELQVSRLDKFSYGASSELSEKQRLQVGSELETITDNLGDIWLRNSTGKRRLIESQGIDPERLLDDKITPDYRKALVEKHLEKLEILSTDPDYDPDRDGTAKDNKFQVYIRPGSKNAAVNSKQRVVIIADKNISMNNTLSVEAGHEVTHAVQTINSDMIPLKLFERIGGGGSSAFSEGGAMYVQDKITKKLFGYEAANHPHYIRAMATRLKGANYPETVKVFHNSSMEPWKIMKDNGDITEEEFQKELSKSLKLAIDRCKRLFSGSRLDSKGSHLTGSKSTVYLEQSIVFDKLKERGLEKLFQIRGMSLENIIALMKLGYLKTEDIKEPDYHFIEDTWNEVKPEYEKTTV